MQNLRDYAFCDVCGTKVLTAGPMASLAGLGRHSDQDPELTDPDVATSSVAADEEAVDEEAVDEEAVEPELAEPRPWVGPISYQLAPGLARLYTVVGLLLALGGEAYLQFANPSNTTKALGMLGLVVGAALFGLGAISSFLADVRRWSSHDRFDLRAVFRPGPPALAAGVGTIAFVTLIIRLWTGSTAATDLILWAVALLAFTMAIVGEVTDWRPSDSQMLEAGAVSVLVAVFIVLNARDLNDWYFSAIGDEYAFLAAASGVLADGIRKPFSQEGVYGAHPMLGTLFQAAVMRVFGNNHFGWVLSSVLSAALAIPAVYLVGRTLAGPAVGLIAAALFGFNHYLFAFAHLGYNNIMAPAPTVWAIALFMLSRRRPRIGLLFACGIAAGLGFYTFYSARTTLPIIGLFLIAMYSWRETLTWQHWQEQTRRFWPIALGFVLAAGPIFAASGTAVITRMFNEVPGGYAESVTGPPGQKVLANFWLNVPAFFYNTHTAHYISGSLLDPLTGVLAALGIGLAIRWWGHPGARLLLVWALVAIGITALLSPHPTPAITRLLFDVPPLAIVGALAARQLWENLFSPDPETSRPMLAAAAVGVLVVVVLGLNVQRFWFETPKRYHMTQDAVVVGAVRSDLCGGDPSKAIVVMRGHGLLRGALTSYRPERDLPRFVKHEDLKPGQVIPVEGFRCVVFGDPNDPPAKEALANLLRVHQGSMVSPFRDGAGIGTVMIFTPTQVPTGR